MFICTRCEKSFPCMSRFKAHSLRKVPCRPSSHFCSMCNSGLVSRRSLWAHKKRCRNRPQASIETEARIQSLKKKVDAFFEHLSSDFTAKLNELEKIFDDENSKTEVVSEAVTVDHVFSCSTLFGTVLDE